jgi:hypothetical protein
MNKPEIDFDSIIAKIRQSSMCHPSAYRIMAEAAAAASRAANAASAYHTALYGVAFSDMFQNTTGQCTAGGRKFVESKVVENKDDKPRQLE